MNINISRNNISNKRITIIGLQKSGYASAILGNELGATIFVSELNINENIIKNKKKLNRKGIQVEIGTHSNQIYQADIWIISPGVPTNIDIIKKANKLKISIISEIEFASYFTKLPIIAVTGSNGKSTTVNILYSMLNTKDLNPILAGNIGIPFSEQVLKEIEDPEFGNIYILEVSSFQLEYIKNFKPAISVYLNISPDHLDRHKNMEQYLNAKLELIKNQNSNDIVVFNADEKIFKSLFNNYPLKKIPFSILNKTSFFHINKSYIYNQNNELLISKKNIKLKGDHNLSNLIASATVAKLMKVKDKKIVNVMENFKSINHRLQEIKKINGVSYINDSKATNIQSVIVAINSFNNPIILLLGGKNKNSNFRQLLPHTKRHVKHIVSYGEAGGEIAAAIGDAVRLDCVNSLKEAVASAQKFALKGDIILLSPGCASFDQFKNFEERGNKFIKIVKMYSEKICV